MHVVATRLCELNTIRVEMATANPGGNLGLRVMRNVLFRSIRGLCHRVMKPRGLRHAEDPAAPEAIHWPRSGLVRAPRQAAHVLRREAPLSPCDHSSTLSTPARDSSPARIWVVCLFYTMAASSTSLQHALLVESGRPVAPALGFAPARTLRPAAARRSSYVSARLSQVSRKSLRPDMATR